MAKNEAGRSLVGYSPLKTKLPIIFVECPKSRLSGKKNITHYCSFLLKPTDHYFLFPPFIPHFHQLLRNLLRPPSGAKKDSATKFHSLLKPRDAAKSKRKEISASGCLGVLEEAHHMVKSSIKESYGKKNLDHLDDKFHVISWEFLRVYMPERNALTHLLELLRFLYCNTSCFPLPLHCTSFISQPCLCLVCQLSQRNKNSDIHRYLLEKRNDSTRNIEYSCPNKMLEVNLNLNKNTDVPAFCYRQNIYPWANSVCELAACLPGPSPQQQGRIPGWSIDTAIEGTQPRCIERMVFWKF